MNAEQYLHPVGAAAAGTLADAASVASGGADQADFQQAVLILDLGSLAGTLECELQTSDSLGSGYADASPAMQIDVPATDDDKNLVLRWNLKASTQLKRYVRVNITSNGGSNVITGALFCLANPGDTEALNDEASESTYVYDGRS